MSQVEHSHTVSREEFEAHRRQVSQDIAGLADAIKEEGRQRSFDTQTLRKDIKDLANTSGKPQYQALTFAFGVFSFVCIALAAVYTWGEEARWKGITNTTTLLEYRLREHELSVTKTNASQDERLKNLESIYKE